MEKITNKILRKLLVVILKYHLLCGHKGTYDFMTGEEIISLFT